MAVNKILSAVCLIVCLTIVLSSPIPEQEINTLPRVVELDSVVKSNIEQNVRVARHLFKHKYQGGGGCRRCGGGYDSGHHGGGGYGGGSGSFAGAAAGSFGGGNTNAQAQAASFGFGPFSASFASSFAGSRGGGFYDYKK